MNDISVFNIQVTLVASVTFPTGVILTQFADDADPFDSPAQQLSETTMGVNGDLIVASTANPIALTMNLIPQSDDDINLAVLAEANRVGRGKSSARDVITVTAIYPNGSGIILTQGTITNAILADSAASSGRFKSKPYTFSFENKAKI